ncbi:phasin family protein [Paraburkholderia sp. PGU19]|uniref:phasin family protein n=1 Tax=Paraburkholderia sp. PGU19 TaxID=2735434 RepID=UPI0015DB7FBF|nr:phasin family protein [Paraburkholderia sp. PGU19]
MSSLSREQAVASQRARFETLSDAWTKAFGCIEKLTELKLRAVKATLAENQAIASMALSTKVDPQELFILQAKRAQAAMEEAQSYWRHGCSTRTTTSTRSKLRADRDRCEIKRPLPKPNHAVQYKSYSLKMSLTSSSFEDFVEPSKPSNWMGVFLWLEALRSS